ncbi:MAG: hypothetical protein A2V74_02410 [Acidobacteria bacterium RBG_16_70_10]|nr:MAG: hypothetical protein A2V74_02410 [Acidobacteria bacterium RBG_16_70_10]
MILAVNKVCEHEGKQYHLQAEDLGAEAACFEVRIFERGTVLWQKRVSYTDILERRLPREEQDVAVHALMEKTVHTVEAAIARGKLP